MMRRDLLVLLREIRDGLRGQEARVLGLEERDLEIRRLLAEAEIRLATAVSDLGGLLRAPVAFL